MKKFLFLIMAALLLTACGNDKANGPESKQEKEAIDVSVNVEPIVEDGKVYFVGETNLPDNATLMFTVSGPNDYTAQTKEVVSDGKFETEVFSARGESLPVGKYDLSVSLSIPSTQDEAFLKDAGENYEYLTGDLMDESELGKSMDYETTFTID